MPDIGNQTVRTTGHERPLVVLHGVEKRFSNGTLAVSNFNGKVQAHEFVSLLGPSGCGKSTILRMIAGLGAPTAGAIEWPSASSVEPSKPQREISFVFQEATLMPWATALNNVRLPLRLSGVRQSESEQRAAEALRLVGLTGFEGAYPRELSGGMKMRVSIARAIVTRPRILLMDEPFAALDEITRFKLNNDLLELWVGQSWTVVFVTHSVFESVYLSQRILVMAARPGRVSSELAIDSPYPREEAFRTSVAYADHCRRVTAELHRAMAVR